MPPSGAQEQAVAATDQIPEEVWYWAAMGAIGASAILKLMKKDNWALFVGQWPPTFLILRSSTRCCAPAANRRGRDAHAAQHLPPAP